MRIIDKIFRDKKGNTVIYLLLTVGIVLLALGGSFKSEAPQTAAEENFHSSKEQKLQSILSHINGVGEAQVMISFCEEEDGLLFNEKNGEEGNVKGVVVVAQGGADAKVREKIIRATKAALGVEAHKIEVFERKEKQ